MSKMKMLINSEAMYHNVPSTITSALLNFKRVCLFISIFLIPIVAFSQRDTIVSNYNGESELKAGSSVTLKDGFYAPEGSNLRVYITGVSFLNCFALSSSPSSNQNYISTRTFKVPGILTDNDANASGRSTCELNQSIQYFDGLGRPLQTVTVQGSPSGKDLVQPFVYDAFGREATKYQPYSATANGGAYRADVELLPLSGDIYRSD